MNMFPLHYNTIYKNLYNTNSDVKKIQDVAARTQLPSHDVPEAVLLSPGRQLYVQV